MKKNNNIDHIFSEGLANYSETPPAFIWDAIADRIQGTKKNKKALILWRGLAAAAIIGLIFLGGLFWNNKNNTLADANLQQPNSALSSDIDNDNRTNNNKVSIDKDFPAKQEAQADITQSQNLSVNKDLHLPVAKNDMPATDTRLSASDVKTNRDYNDTDNTRGADNSLQDNKQAITSSGGQSYAQRNTPINADAKDVVDNNIQLLEKLDVQTDHVLIDYTEPDATQLVKSRGESILKNSKTDNWVLALNKEESEQKTAKKGLQFALGGQFSPSYSYRETSSSDASNMAANNEEGIMSYTGGINLNIKTRKRWEIETGVYYSQVGQKFSNPLIGHSDKMTFAAGSNAGIESKQPNLQNSLGNITLEASAQQELITEVAVSNATAAYRLNSNNVAYSSNQMDAITVQQELDYIEIPFLLRYKMLDKSVGLSISGGMSTNFLIGNNAYRIENSAKSRIGETQNINEISYSAIFGVGLRTPILKSLDFNFEPRVKYFINSITDTSGSDYKPYSIGIYTGVSYRF